MGTKPDRLEEGIFSYQITKKHTVLIYWYNQHVTTLSGQEALKFIREMETASEREAQLRMARVTGNFKRGNERHNPQE